MPLLQYAFVALLIGVLVAAVATFAVMGLAKVVRSNRLARSAHEHGMRFSRDDPYAVPHRYEDFAVISSGHSPRANNVTDGRLGGWPVRAFDFRCELGHGTRRTTRHYNVTVVETEIPAGYVLMWNAHDAEMAPLAASRGQRLMPGWSCHGSEKLAGEIAEASRPIWDAGASIEVRRSMVMIAAPASRSRREYGVSFDDVHVLVQRLRQASDADGKEAKIAGNQDVEKPPGA